MKNAVMVLVAAVALVAALSGPAWGGTVIVQQGLNGYTSAQDTTLEGHPNWDVQPMRWSNLGGRQYLYTYSASWNEPVPGVHDERTSLLQFGNLNAAIGAAPADVTSAVLQIQLDPNQLWGGVVKVSKMLTNWQGGTGGLAACDVNGVPVVPPTTALWSWDYPDYSLPVDGANHFYRNAPTVAPAVANWTPVQTLNSGNVVYSMPAPAGLAHVQYNNSIDSDSTTCAKPDPTTVSGWPYLPDPTRGWQQAPSLVDLLADARTAPQWAVDGGNLYIDVNPALAASYGISYYLNGDKWAGTGAYDATDTNLGDLRAMTFHTNPDGTGTVTLDVTDLVQGWLADPSSNFGVELSDTGDANYLAYMSSEFPDVSQRPQLIVDTVPEPATMALLAIGGLATLIRKRK